MEYTYDHAGRFVSSSESRSGNNSYKNEYSVSYDGLGRVIESENILDYLASTDSYTTSLRSVYEYNPDGTLKDERIYAHDTLINMTSLTELHATESGARISRTLRITRIIHREHLQAILSAPIQVG